MTFGSPRSQFGSPRRHFRRTDSTNERAIALAAGGASCGTVVTAAEQSAGRGRHGRTWSAPAGKALLCSAILRPLDRTDALLPLAAPLAVCEAAESLGSGDCAIKWPNDVWIDGRKLGGILIEARPPEWAVIGIGLNLSIEADEFPAELRATATSIGTGAGPDLALAAVCERLDVWVAAARDRVLDEFRRRDALAGREVRWSGAGRRPDRPAQGRGIAAGIDDDGNLLVRTAARELVALGAGEVHLGHPDATSAGGAESRPAERAGDSTR